MSATGEPHANVEVTAAVLDRPRVTVIIATFNWSEVLPYSIASVQRQTFRDWELLVIGDGCTDDSANVVGAIAAQDQRIRWINLPRNTGHQSGPNNQGLRQGRGDIVAYLGGCRTTSPFSSPRSIRPRIRQILPSDLSN